MGKLWLLILLLVCLCDTSFAKKKKKSTSAEAKKTHKANNKDSWSSLWDESSNLLSISPQQRKGQSYLFVDSHPNDVVASFIQDIVDVIYAKQHPQKDLCSKRRLLVLQMTSSSFEGTGSLLKQVMLGTAAAMHSNRTMVWGLGLPFIFEHTKEIWNANSDLSAIKVNNETIDCRQEDPSAGPLGCFFQPISSCSLEDASPSDLLTFSEHPSNHSARLFMAEMSTGIAMYHPPLGLFDYIWSKRNYPAAYKAVIIERQSYVWAAAVTAYVFRIKPALLSSLTKKFEPLFPPPSAQAKPATTWGMHVRHGDLKALSNIYSYKEVFDFEDYFAAGMKVSHALQTRPDRVFVSTDSVEADQLSTIFDRFMTQRHKRFAKMSTVQGQRELDEEEDDDGDDGNNEDEECQGDDDQCEREDDEDDDEDEDEDEDDDAIEDAPDQLERLDRERQRDLNRYVTWWYDEDIDDPRATPKVFTIPNDHRYRTEHGSHTVAANGGCLRDEKYKEKGMRCALHYEAIVQYQSMDEHRSQPRSLRLMRVLLESIEDLYLLSKCDALIAQGSSHFSTLAALLIWARTLGYDTFQPTTFTPLTSSPSTPEYLQRIHFLDEDGIRAGFTPTGFLHGMNLLNGTVSVDTRSVDSGIRRWQVHTAGFQTALPESAQLTWAYPTAHRALQDSITRYWASQPQLFEPDGWLDNPIRRIHLEHHLPQMQRDLFYLETRHWLGFVDPSTWLGSFSPSAAVKGKPLVSTAIEDYVPFLPGQCPPLLHFPATTARPLTRAEDIATVFDYVAQTINLGVDHLNASHIGQAMLCWSNAKEALKTYPEIFSRKSQQKLQSLGGRHAQLFHKQEDLNSVLRDNMAFVRVTRYAEMAINENRNTREYYRYTEKYMQRPYDGVDRDAAGRHQTTRGGHEEDSSAAMGKG